MEKEYKLGFQFSLKKLFKPVKYPIKIEKIQEKEPNK
jgi:hypothetical protein